MTDEDGKQGARPRLHRLWAPTIVMAVVLVVAGVTTAGAQSTATVRVSIHVTTANVTDRAGALAMFDRRRANLSQVQNVLVDGDTPGNPLPRRCRACWEPRWKW